MDQRPCRSDSRPRNAKTRPLELIEDERARLAAERIVDGGGLRSSGFIGLSSLGRVRTTYNGNILVY